MTEPTTLAAYTQVRRERDGRTFWIRVGEVKRETNGDLVVKLDAIPTNGEIVIRSGS